MRQIRMRLFESNLLFRIMIGPGVCGNFHLCKGFRQVRFHFLIVTVIFGKLAVFIHQIICQHKELQLLINRIDNQMLRFSRLR